MTRQEAVQKLATTGCLSIAHAEDLYDSFFPKPVVPQYVVDWYEEHKDDLETALYQEVRYYEEDYEEGGWTDFQDWLVEKENKSLRTLVNMHQFGYEVEKEPRYTVRIKGIKGDRGYLNCDRFSNTWSFEDDDTSLDRFRVTHTHKELEDADFGWVFDCPGVEVKEVE